jgi:uncharacterized protein YndB with AHSA1/START domain
MYATKPAPDTISFERTIDAPQAKVWSLISTSDGLKQWLGTTSIELKQGGDFIAQLTEDVTMHGRILTLDPPHRLTISWHEICNGESTDHATTGNQTSEISFALEALDENKTKLTFVHRLIQSGETMFGFAGGWHCYLDTLQAVLENRPEPNTSFTDLMVHYERALA